MIKTIELKGESKDVELSEICDLKINVFDGASLTLKLLNLGKVSKINILGSVGKDSNLNIVFADFSDGDIELISHIDLVGENASCKWHLATLSNKENKKTFDVSFNHEVGHTSALMDNYGVARGESKIVFSGCNHIKNGAKFSDTNQIAKIIVFDEKANGIASPMLKIDENEVSASHSAVVGQLNSDHMFYLMSRGLSKDEARELITRGYLQPISKKFSEENRNKIENAIKEAM